MENRLIKVTIKDDRQEQADTVLGLFESMKQADKVVQLWFNSLKSEDDRFNLIAEFESIILE